MNKWNISTKTLFILLKFAYLIEISNIHETFLSKTRRIILENCDTEVTWLSITAMPHWTLQFRGIFSEIKVTPFSFEILLIMYSFIFYLSMNVSRAREWNDMNTISLQLFDKYDVYLQR